LSLLIYDNAYQMNKIKLIRLGNSHSYIRITDGLNMLQKPKHQY